MVLYTIAWSVDALKVFSCSVLLRGVWKTPGYLQGWGNGQTTSAASLFVPYWLFLNESRQQDLSNTLDTDASSKCWEFLIKVLAEIGQDSSEVLMQSEEKLSFPKAHREGHWTTSSQQATPALTGNKSTGGEWLSAFTAPASPLL